MSNSAAQISQTQTRRQKVEHREEAIIAAASSLFNDKGYRKTTISDIARQSGVADGTVYLYFKNKEDVARAVLADFYDGLTQSAQNGVDALSSPRERIEFFARHHMGEVIGNWRILEIVSTLGHTIDNYEGSDIYALNRAYSTVFIRVAKDAIQQGEFAKDTSPTILRDIFFGSLEYGVRTLMIKRQQNDIENFVQGLMNILFGSGQARNGAVGNQLADRLDQAVSRMEQMLDENET